MVQEIQSKQYFSLYSITCGVSIVLEVVETVRKSDRNIKNEVRLNYANCTN